MPSTRPIATALLALAFTIAGCGAGDDMASGQPSVPESPLAEVTGYSTGLEDAPITIIEFSDFGCPYCAQFAVNSYPELHSEFVLSGRVRWVYVPFVLGIFPNGDAAALAGECAGEQDRFWPMHDVLYARQGEWKRNGDPESIFVELARDARLDIDTFLTCYRENEPAERIERHNQIADQLGIRATPTFFIDGQIMEGAPPLDTFRAILEPIRR